MKPETVLDVVVGFLLVDRQLLSTILQAEHPQTLVEPLLVDAVLALHLPIVAGRSDADAVVEDVILFQLDLKQALVVRIVGDQCLGELRAVVRLNLTDREGAALNPVAVNPVAVNPVAANPVAANPVAAVQTKKAAQTNLKFATRKAINTEVVSDHGATSFLRWALVKLLPDVDNSVCKDAAVPQTCNILYRRLSCSARHLQDKWPENMDLYRHLSRTARHLQDKTSSHPLN